VHVSAQASIQNPSLLAARAPNVFHFQIHHNRRRPYRLSISELSTQRDTWRPDIVPTTFAQWQSDHEVGQMMGGRLRHVMPVLCDV
jgi:hypothetical protein